MDCSSTSRLTQSCDSTITKLSLPTSTDPFAPSSTTLRIRFTGADYVTDYPISPPTEVRDCIVFRRDPYPSQVQTVRLTTLAHTCFETIIPPDCLTVEVHKGDEVHTLKPGDYVTFELHGSGLKYRAGKKGKKPEVDTTFDPDDGMRMESEYDQQREITAASKQELSGRHM
jgi:hypothetical protein